MKPLLAHTYKPERWLDRTIVYLQPKLNGVRALYQNGHFQSREELPWNEPVLRHLSQPLKLMFPDDRLILDGELYVHGWPLQRINGAIAINRLEPCEDTFFVEYHIFDSVSYTKTFDERFYALMKYKGGLFDNNIKVRLVPTFITDNYNNAEDYYAEQVGRGYEGIMYRIGDCPYTRPKQPSTVPGRRRYLSDKHNRCWHLLKRKDWRDDEFTCVRVDEGEGKRRGMVGAFICETSGGRYFGVGSGLTEAEAIYYYDNPPVGRKIRVKYLTLTSDGIPFNPTVLAVL